MPRSVKIFLGLCLVYAASTIAANFGPLLFPSARQIEVAASLPADLRAMAHQAEWFAAGLRSFIALAFFVIFAVAAAFGRRNWARWVLALLLIATEFTSFLVVGALSLRYSAFGFTPESVWDIACQNWMRQWSFWQSWAWLALKLALIATMFGPGTRAWFRRL